MECKIYGFEELDECYLAVPEDVLLDNIINDMPWIPGKPRHINDMSITERSLILGLTPREVLQDIASQGYHLKWPTQTVCHLLYMQCMYCREYLGVMEVPYAADEGDINVTHLICDTCKGSDAYKKSIGVLLAE